MGCKKLISISLRSRLHFFCRKRRCHVTSQNNFFHRSITWLPFNQRRSYCPAHTRWRTQENTFFLSLPTSSGNASTTRQSCSKKKNNRLLTTAEYRANKIRDGRWSCADWRDLRILLARPQTRSCRDTTQHATRSSSFIHIVCKDSKNYVVLVFFYALILPDYIIYKK